MKRYLQDLDDGKELSPDHRQELEAYLQSPYREPARRWNQALPLDDAPFVEIWETWEMESRGAQSKDPRGVGKSPGALEVLREHLPQLSFPIREGISQTPAYRSATLAGNPSSAFPEAIGLSLERPEEVRLILHSSLAGRIPYLQVPHRPDFVRLVQALARRNEPVPVPAAQGAAAVAGYNNWARIWQHRERWESLPPEQRANPSWREEMVSLRPRKELYQDTFLILSRGPYSGVDAADLGLDEGRWLDLSLRIRLEHEATHCFTRRALGGMRNNLLDELLADYAGLRAATGRFPADWFLHCLGLGAEDESPRSGARVEIYRGDPPLSDPSFAALLELVRRAARQVERFAAELPQPDPEELPAHLGRELVALAQHRLDELAAENGAERLRESYKGLASVVGTAEARTDSS
ncbi:MAG: hypothetical protein SX243_23200 [Acidobacteriota bacterium]|nr:hypothetical protein [Acidobacteriota bacterium]